MPRAPRRCPGCDDALITAPKKYCPACLKEKAWAGSNRGPETAGRPWRRVRAAVLDRDGHRCVTCGSSEHLEADHITPVARGGTDDPSNLRTLCRACHRKVTAAKGGRAPRSRAVDADLIDMSESRRLRDLPGY